MASEPDLTKAADRGRPMTDVIVFHHAQGLTPGVHEFAEQLRAAGHHVATPDLYDGATFDTLQGGIAFAERIGFDVVVERGRLAAEGLPNDIVYAGFSLGVMPAQLLAQTRPGGRGALLFHACVPPSEFGSPWPGVPVQIHAMEEDALFVTEGDLDAARQLVETIEDAELFLYPGDQHLFADVSLPSYREEAATVLTQRVLRFLQDLG
jgi:dienelactone hydrolase